MSRYLKVAHHVQDRIGQVGRHLAPFPVYFVGSLDSDVGKRYFLRDIQEL